MLTESELESFRVMARDALGDKRYHHVQNVTRLAAELAETYGENIISARAAALLHDVTKEAPLDSQLQKIRNSDILYDSVLLSTTNVYHSLTAYLYARDQLHIHDEDILNAIRYHTTGRAGMSRLEKIVFIADTVSYERSYPDVSRLRTLAFRDLDGCMLAVMVYTIQKLIGKCTIILPDTISCYNEMCALMAAR